MQLPIEKGISKIKTVPVSAELKLQCRQRILKLWEVFRARNIIFALPTVSFDLRGKVGGKAFLEKNHIQLNAVLLNENPEQYLNTVIGHELAHLACFNAFKERGHGKAWGKCMEMLGLPATRCHTMDTSNASVVAQLKATCKCENGHNISVRRKAALLKGELRCKKCKSIVEPADPSLLSLMRALQKRVAEKNKERGITEETVITRRSSAAPLPVPSRAPMPIKKPVVLPVPARGLKKPVELPTIKQIAYMNVLANKHGVLIPDSAITSKEAASAWISQHK